MKKIFIRSIIGLLATTTVLVAVFIVTRGMDPHAAELAFVEASESGIGSVIPASCESGYSHFGDCSPPTVSVAISPNPALPDGLSEHTITSTIYYGDGVNHVRESQVAINLQGGNAGSHRGMLGWSNIGFPGWFGVYKSAPIACTGGGFGAVYGGGYGPEYINLVSCSVSSVSVQTRVISYVVRFNTNFTAPINNNTLSGYVHTGYADSGWIPSGTFSLQQPSPSLDCVLPWGGTLFNGGSVTAYQYSSAPTCTSETRTCVNGVLSGSFTNQTCTAGSCPVGTTLQYDHPSRACSNLPQGGLDYCTTPARGITATRLSDGYNLATHQGMAALARDHGCSKGYWSGSNNYCWGNAVNGVCPTQWNTPGTFDWGADRWGGEHEQALLCFPSEVPVCVPNNLPPSANAGPDMIVEQAVGAVTVSGATANDPEGQPMTYNWTSIVSPGSVPTISGGTTLTPTFSNLVTLGTYVFRLSVTDSAGNVTSDTMNITVIGISPTLDTANATNCQIQAGQSQCGSQVSWVINNPFSPSVTATQSGRLTTQISTSGSGAMTHQIPYGPTVFEFIDAGQSLGTRTAMATCAPGTIWNGVDTCILLQGTITANPDLVPLNGLTTITWNVVNPGIIRCGVVSTDNVSGRRVISSDYSSPPGGYADTEPIASQRTYFLWCNTTTNIVDTAVVTIARPALTATPRVVQRGSTTNLNYNTQGQDCTLLGNAVTGVGTITTPAINAQTTFTLICPLGTASATVELLPIGFET